MSKVAVAVFSGTGNASRAAGIIAGVLTNSGHSVETLDLAASGQIPALGTGDTLVVCSSTLGFSVPSTVMESLRAVPRTNGTKVAIACVCGATGTRSKIASGWSGAASIAALSVLKRKGFVPVGSADISYPENWTQVSEAAQGDAAAAMIERGDAESLAFAAMLAEGRQEFLRRNILTRTLGRFVGFIFRHAARMILAKLYIADDTCTACGLCDKLCPSCAITMHKGSPAWSIRCSACNRCINVCPSSSIQTSVARLVLFAAANIAAMFVSPSLAESIIHAVWPASGGTLLSLVSLVLSIVLYIAFTAVQLGPLDALVRKLERMRALRPLFTASYTRHYARYLAPGFKPGK